MNKDPIEFLMEVCRQLSFHLESLTDPFQVLCGRKVFKPNLVWIQFCFSLFELRKTISKIVKQVSQTVNQMRGGSGRKDGKW